MSEQQRCTVMVEGKGWYLHHCNLAIERFGPCAYVFDGGASASHRCGEPPENRHYDHPYQPSQWRHVWDGVPDGPTSLGRSGLDHEAQL